MLRIELGYLIIIEEKCDGEHKYVFMKLIVWLNETLINEKIKWEFMETISRMIKYV